MNVDGLCLGVSLGMSTTAEGVETKEQLDRLRALHRDTGLLCLTPEPGTGVQLFFPHVRKAASAA